MQAQKKGQTSLTKNPGTDHADATAGMGTDHSGAGSAHVPPSSDSALSQPSTRGRKQKSGNLGTDHATATLGMGGQTTAMPGRLCAAPPLIPPRANPEAV